jgi:transposase
MPHARALYRKRHKIENMFGKRKDWRRIHTCHDRCEHIHGSHRCSGKGHLLSMTNEP